MSEVKFKFPKMPIIVFNDRLDWWSNQTDIKVLPDSYAASYRERKDFVRICAIEDVSSHELNRSNSMQSIHLFLK